MSNKVQQSVCSDCVTYVKSRIKFNTFNTFNNVDVVMPNMNLEYIWQGTLDDVPEEYLNCSFRPIDIVTDFEDRIHLIVN